MTDQIKKRVQVQFGDKAGAYAASAVHADRTSLGHLVENALGGEARPDWLVLDVATGAGHTAHAFREQVRRVVAADLTLTMLAQARAGAREYRLSDLDVTAADAELLPFGACTFDLVTCRLAAHHFPHVEQFMAEVERVLRPGGRLALVDNIVPGSRLRGKKGRLQREAGRYVNAFDRLRDPSHVRALALYEWQDAFAAAGLAIQHQQLSDKMIDFNDWAARMKVPADDRRRLQAMLLRAPREALEFLTPQTRGDTIKFRLSEALIIGKKED